MKSKIWVSFCKFGRVTQQILGQFSEIMHKTPGTFKVFNIQEISKRLLLKKFKRATFKRPKFLSEWMNASTD